jgi:hypothetical protein
LGDLPKEDWGSMSMIRDNLVMRKVGEKKGMKEEAGGGSNGVKGNQYHIVVVRSSSWLLQRPSLQHDYNYLYG